MNQAVHPGGLNAAQSLAFFKANGITGKIVRRTRGVRVLVEYRHLAKFLDGSVAPFGTRILALAEDQNLEAAS